LKKEHDVNTHYLFSLINLRTVLWCQSPVADHGGLGSVPERSMPNLCLRIDSGSNFI